MKQGICITTLSTPEDPWGFRMGAVLKDAGFSYMELNLGAFGTMTEEAFSDFARQVRACALPAETGNCLFPGTVSLYGDQSAAVEYLEKLCGRCNILGIDAIVFGSGGLRRCPEGMKKEDAFQALVRLLNRCIPVLEAHRITLVVEPLNRGETDMFNNTGTAAELVRAVDHPSVRLLVDYFHYGREADHLLPENVPLIQHVHWAELKDRTCPAEFHRDFLDFLRLLRDNGWDGRMSFEGGQGPLSREEYLQNILAVPGKLEKLL